MSYYVLIQSHSKIPFIGDVMKSLKKLIALGSFSLLILGFLPWVHAYKAPLMDIETLLKSGGDNSMWFSGKLIDKEEKFKAKGMPYTVLTFEVQKVLKGQPASYEHPTYKTRLTKSQPPKTIKVNIFGNASRGTLVPGVGTELELGAEGIFGFYGASKLSFTSLVGGSSQGAFIKQSNGKLANGLQNNVLKVSNLSNKNERLSQTLKTLKTQQAIDQGAVDAKELETLILGLSEILYPQAQ